MFLELLNNGLCYLWGEGDWKLRPFHQQVIEAVVDYLDAEKGNKIKLQLEQQYFMQFIPEGRINTFFFRKLPDDLVIRDPAFQDCLFKVEVFADGRKHYAQVTFVKGRILSIEFKKPHKFFVGKDIQIGTVTPGQPKDSFTAVIDRAAHSSETEENP
jgi:hypothetical protein